MAQGFKTIETKRLVLRGIDVTDAELIVKWRSVPDVYKYFKSPHKITLEEHLNWYNFNYISNANRFDWICTEKMSRNRIGVFGLYRQKENVEVNYLLAPEWQHKGYAAEAIQALINFATIEWNNKQVIAEIHIENQPSIELVQKLGFELISRRDSFVIYGIKV